MNSLEMYTVANTLIRSFSHWPFANNNFQRNSWRYQQRLRSIAIIFGIWNKREIKLSFLSKYFVIARDIVHFRALHNMHTPIALRIICVCIMWLPFGVAAAFFIWDNVSMFRIHSHTETQNDEYHRMCNEIASRKIDQNEKERDRNRKQSSNTHLGSDKTWKTGKWIWMNCWVVPIEGKTHEHSKIRHEIAPIQKRGASKWFI